MATKAPAKKAAAAKSPAKPAPKTAKKIAEVKTDKKAAAAWSTIHIFGYGETQIIGRDINGKVKNADLKSLEPLIASLAEKQQKGTKISIANTHALNIFNGTFIDFKPKAEPKNAAQRIGWAEAEIKYIDKLVAELVNKLPEQQPRKGIIKGRRKKIIAAKKKAIAD